MEEMLAQSKDCSVIGKLVVERALKKAVLMVN